MGGSAVGGSVFGIMGNVSGGSMGRFGETGGGSLGSTGCFGSVLISQRIALDPFCFDLSIMPIFFSAFWSSSREQPNVSVQ